MFGTVDRQTADRLKGKQKQELHVLGGQG